MAEHNQPTGPTNTAGVPPSTTTTTRASSPVLCPHCKRTANNGIRCQGICVADNDY
ncbi:MAG: hypothetical protein VKK03_04030 [Synechococcus sp.]|nr:hypothetical protein [Synechococcus sp.]